VVIVVGDKIVVSVTLVPSTDITTRMLPGRRVVRRSGSQGE
jgi:hypothetical protein